MFVNIVSLLGVGDDVEDGPDAYEHSAEHRPQLGLQVEARDLTQQRVVAGHVSRKLKHDIDLLFAYRHNYMYLRLHVMISFMNTDYQTKLACCLHNN